MTKMEKQKNLVFTLLSLATMIHQSRSILY